MCSYLKQSLILWNFVPPIELYYMTDFIKMQTCLSKIKNPSFSGRGEQCEEICNRLINIVFQLMFLHGFSILKHLQ